MTFKLGGDPGSAQQKLEALAPVTGAREEARNSEARDSTVRISYSGMINAEVAQLVPRRPLPPGHNIFDGNDLRATACEEIVRSGIGVVRDPLAFEHRHDFFQSHDWLIKIPTEVAQAQQLSFLTTLVNVVGEEALLKKLGIHPTSELQGSQPEERIHVLAHLIVNEGRAAVDSDPLEPGDWAIKDALMNIQAEYLASFSVDHVRLADEPPQGYEFIPSAKEVYHSDVSASERIWAERDKVADRRLAEEIGILKQPRYLDSRDFNRSLQSISYSTIDLSAFPRDEAILNAQPGQDKIVVFENAWKGFCILHVEGKAFVASFNPRIDAAIQSAGLHVPNETLNAKAFEEFLSSLERDQHIFSKSVVEEGGSQTSDHHRSIDATALAQLVASHNEGPLYLKSARTSGGTCILKIWRDPTEGLVIESNSPEIKERLSRMESTLRKLLAFPNSPQFLIGQAGSALEPTKFLEGLIHSVHAPILEEEIPMAPCMKGRAEPRIIYQRGGDLKLERTGTYCKYSESNVAANVALGGRGISVEEAIQHILIAQEVEPSKLAEEVERTQSALFKAADEFALEFGKRHGTWLRQFAVDIAFVWNKETSQLDFYLIEVQRGFAYAGLRQVDPEAAARVDRLSQASELRLWSFLKGTSPTT